MKIASLAEVKSQFSAFVKASADGPVVVTKNGRAVAVLVGVQDEEEVERLLMGYSPRLREILDASRKQISEGQGIDHDEFWAQAAPPKARKGRGKQKGKISKAGGASSDKEGTSRAEPGPADRPGE
jgi:prevent-host-death family protein